MMSEDTFVREMANLTNPLGERLARLETNFEQESRRNNERHVQNTGRLEEILHQTTTTNGRVTILEGWLNKVKGGWWIMIGLATMVGFLLEKVFK